MTHPTNSRPYHGGKAEGLIELKNVGFNVPLFDIIPADFQLNWLDRRDLTNDFLNTVHNRQKREQLITWFDQQDWSETEEKQLSHIYNTISENGRYRVSVRSSALVEDGQLHSFAGMFESVLDVENYKSFLSAVTTCWKSALDERIFRYIERNNVAGPYIPFMPLVVQRMAGGEVSGVLFTWDVQHQSNGFIVNAAPGAGEGVVFGNVEADNFILDEQGSIIEKHIHTNGRDYGCLSPEYLEKLSDAGRKIHHHNKYPQDIEFTFEGNELYILQSRDITTANFGSRVTVFDNSNIVESYPEVTTPLTYTFIRPAYEEVYRKFFELMGLSPKKLETYRRDYATMVCWIDGRVYYNLNSWFRTLSSLPGYRFNRDAMEKMMGVEQPGAYQHVKLPEGYHGIKKFTHGYPEIIKLIWRIFRNHAKSEKMVRDFMQRFHSIFDELEAENMEQKPARELADLFYQLEDRLLTNWKAPIVTDLYAMIFHGLLDKLTQKWLPDHPTLNNELLAGEGDVESAEPTRKLVEMGDGVRKDERLFRLFKSMDAGQLYARSRVDPAFGQLNNRVVAYLQKYGYRCAGELKLEQETLRERPQDIFRLIGQFVDSGLDPGELSSRERQIRAEAERKLSKHLGFFRRIIYRIVLKRARRHIRNRENLRFNRTRIFGKVREIFLGIGRDMKRNGWIDEVNDIFFLTRDELLGYVDATTVTRNFKGLISLRKEELEENKNQNVAGRFTVHGAALSSRQNWLEQEQVNQDDEGVLRGIACSPGKITAVARVVENPDQAGPMKGCILVAPQTDPGWVPLFSLASGVLVERGSTLSHAAVVSREMGLPAIVGIPGLMSRIKDGQKITMDGSSGVIEL